MRSKNRVSLAGLPVAGAMAFSNFGCGGGEQTVATLPAPISVSVSPASATLQAGATQQFTATVTNDSANKGVTWSVSCPTAPCGSVSPTSTASGAITTYSAPSTPLAVNLTVTITVTSVSDTTKSGAASVTDLALVVSASASSAALQPGATAQLNAVVSNSPSNSGVAWSLSCSPATSPCGTVSPTTTPSGVATTYTAPLTTPPGGITVTFTATSLAYPSVSSSGTITVPGVTVSVTPNPTQVEAGSTTQLTATVTDDATNAGVSWSVSCAAAPCGSVSPASTPSGTPTTYTAPPNPPTSNLTVNVTATSVAYSPASYSASVTVLAITVSIAPGSALLPVNITQQFTAPVGNDPNNKGVAWAVTQSGTECSPSGGTVIPSTTASGSPTTYTAPSEVPANSTATLAATSVTDTTKTANAAITLTVGTVKLVPDSLDFGTLTEGEGSSPQTVTLTNTGTTTLGITGITITGTNPTQFSETNTCGGSVAAGMSCTITVSFTPSGYGSRSGVASISDTSVDSPQHINLSGTVRKPPGVSNFGCGGGEQIAAAPPTPISVSVSLAVLDRSLVTPILGDKSPSNSLISVGCLGCT